jgi:DNA-binding protein
MNKEENEIIKTHQVTINKNDQIDKYRMIKNTFTYCETAHKCNIVTNLLQENTDLKQKLSSIETFIKIQKEIITEQPSKNKTTDDYFLKKLENILEILRGNNNVKN